MQAKALPDVFNSTGRVVTQRQKQPTDTAESTHSTRCGIRSTQVRRANCETTLYPEGEQVLNRRAAVSTAALLALSCRCHAPAHAALIDEAVAERVFNSAAASVVSITNNVRRGSDIIEEAAGSGFVWDARGYIVTNYHCIQGPFRDLTGSQFTLVRLGDSQQEHHAKYVGIDPSHDLAVLKIDAPAEHLQPIAVGSSGDLRVGQSVFAIGNPFGLSKTLTAGVVSGLNRGIPTPGGAIATRAIQTDAAVSSGNSGGALLDSSGRLIGISTATFSSNKSMGRGSGVNFAISVDVIREIVPNLIVYGTASGKGV